MCLLIEPGSLAYTLWIPSSTGSTVLPTSNKIYNIFTGAIEFAQNGENFLFFLIDYSLTKSLGILAHLEISAI